jgi:hypothetical protein
MPLTKDDIAQIQQAYKAGVRRGRMDIGADVQGATGFSIAHVAKYSPDQTAYAMRRFEADVSNRRGRDVRSLLKGSRKPVLKLTGAEFDRYFPRGPEDGEVTNAGNIFVAQGLTNLVSLWMGLTGTAINPLGVTTATPVCGVGTGTSTPATSDTALLGNGTAVGAYYQIFDSTVLATTTTNGVLVGTSTYASANANFAWNEWCWATGRGLVTAGDNLTATSGSPFATASSNAMVNHKTGVALGTKASGSSWVFSTTFTIS